MMVIAKRMSETEMQVKRMCGMHCFARMLQDATNRFMNMEIAGTKTNRAIIISGYDAPPVLNKDMTAVMITRFCLFPVKKHFTNESNNIIESVYCIRKVYTV